jgi:hypothetical protein
LHSGYDYPAGSDHSIQVTMRGDNIAALYMVTKMQPKSKTLSIIARELPSTLRVPHFVLTLQSIFRNG